MKLRDGFGRAKRVLFVGEAVSLAHVARPLVLGQALAATGRCDVRFAAGERSAGLVERAGFRAERIPTLAPETFMERLSRGEPAYDEATLQDYVRADLSLLRRLAPDLVVGDFRVSLGISCELAGVPYAALANAHWSPHSRQPLPMPEHPLLNALGAGRLARLLFRAAAPTAFRRQAAPFNRLRRAFGLRPVKDIREMYTRGDWTLYLDLPDLVPTGDLPAQHRYLGPVLWEPEVPLPEWWDELPAGRPVVYVTMGSSGDTRALQAVAEALGAMPVSVALATAGRAGIDGLPGNFYTANYLPALRVLSRADLAVASGGSATAYQALARGVPMLALPSNLDQYFTAEAVARAGAGLVVRSGRAAARAVRAAAERLLAEDSFRRSAARLGTAMGYWDAPARFVAFADEALHSRAAAGAGLLPARIRERMRC